MFALPEGYFLQEDLPPQKASTVTIPAEITYYVGSAFVTLNILMNWILYIDVNDVWSMVNSFQISSKLPLFNFPISENNLLWFSTFRKISSFEYLPNELIYSDSFAITKTETWSKSFDWMGYNSTNFMLLLSSQWLYYLVVVTQGLVLVFAHFSGARETVQTQMNLNIMGWYIKLTQVDLWLSLSMLLMIETFYEVFLNSVMGLTILFNYPAIALKALDWLSLMLNMLFWVFIFAFLAATVWFTKTVRKEILVHSQEQSINVTVTGSNAYDFMPKSPEIVYMQGFYSRVLDKLRRLRNWVRHQISRLK